MIFEPNMQMKMQFQHGLLFLLYFAEWLRPLWFWHWSNNIHWSIKEKRLEIDLLSDVTANYRNEILFLLEAYEFGA